MRRLNQALVLRILTETKYRSIQVGHSACPLQVRADEGGSILTPRGRTPFGQ